MNGLLRPDFIRARNDAERILKQVNTFDNNKNSPNRNPDILRAKDIFPSPAKTTSSSQNADGIRTDSEIPKFDLAEQILAGQRRLTAAKRKSPEKVTDTSVLHSKASMTYQPALRSAVLFQQQDFIIKEIVARDIEKLCRGCRIK